MESLGRNETYWGTKFYVYWYYSYWVTLLQPQEEEEEKEELKHEQNGKNSFSHNLDIKWSFHKIVGFHVFCSTDSLEVWKWMQKLNFLMYGEYKNHSNSYKNSTTVLVWRTVRYVQVEKSFLWTVVVKVLKYPISVTMHCGRLIWTL